MEDRPPVHRDCITCDEWLAEIERIEADRPRVVGVRWEAHKRRWFAQGNHKGRKYYLGRFTDYDAACAIVERFRANPEAFNESNRNPAR